MIHVSMPTASIEINANVYSVSFSDKGLNDFKGASDQYGYLFCIQITSVSFLKGYSGYLLTMYGRGNAKSPWPWVCLTKANRDCSGLHQVNR